jgi:hypothetical protein
MMTFHILQNFGADEKPELDDRCINELSEGVTYVALHRVNNINAAVLPEALSTKKAMQCICLGAHQLDFKALGEKSHVLIVEQSYYESMVDLKPRADQMLVIARQYKIFTSVQLDNELAELERLRRIVPKNLHDDTKALVLNSAKAMADKLFQAQNLHGLLNGWKYKPEDESGRFFSSKQECLDGLLNHVMKGDPIDVMAYAAFMSANGWTTNDYEDHIIDRVPAGQLPRNLAESLRDIGMALRPWMKFFIDVNGMKIRVYNRGSCLHLGEDLEDNIQIHGCEVCVQIPKYSFHLSSEIDYEGDGFYFKPNPEQRLAIVKLAKDKQLTEDDVVARPCTVNPNPMWTVFESRYKDVQLYFSPISSL